MANDLEAVPTHPVNAFKLKNFMGFVDTGWINLKPVTLLFGRNSSGKSALIRALRFLRQNIDIPEGMDSLYFAREGGVDLGQFYDFIHMHDTDLSLTIGFNVWLSEEFKKSDQFSTDNDTASIQVEFSFEMESKKLMLTGFSLFDGENVFEGNLIFETKLLDKKPEKGHYSNPEFGVYWSLDSKRFDLDLKFDQNLWEHALPSFDTSFLPIISIPGNIGDTNVNRKEFEGRGDDFTFVTSLLRHFRVHIEDFLRSMTYIGPVREEPKRFYYVPQGISATVGNRGQYTVGRVFSQTFEGNIKQFIDPINNWLGNSKLNCTLDITQVSHNEALYIISIIEESGFRSNLQNVGFGLSQILPILIESSISNQNRLIIIEQPELHLHPEAQAELGDLFALMVKNGTRFLLETHSEHLMLRFRRRIAETTYDELVPNHKQYPYNQGVHFQQDNFKLVYVERRKGESSLEIIEVDHRGQLINPSLEFRVFFNDDLSEVAQLTRAKVAILGVEYDNDNN